MPVRSRSRRQTQWDLGPGSQTAQNPVGSGLIILGNGITPVTDKVTLTRVLGEMTFHLRTASAAGEGFLLTYGMGMVSEDAFAIGVTAIPNPQDDMDWDGWLTHGFVDLRSGTATLSDMGSAVMVRRPIDVKAQRILGNNDIIFMCVDVLEVGTATLSISFDSRSLLKLF